MCIAAYIFRIRDNTIYSFELKDLVITVWGDSANHQSGVVCLFTHLLSVCSPHFSDSYMETASSHTNWLSGLKQVNKIQQEDRDYIPNRGG